MMQDSIAHLAFKCSFDTSSVKCIITLNKLSYYGCVNYCQYQTLSLYAWSYCFSPIKRVRNVNEYHILDSQRKLICFWAMLFVCNVNEWRNDARRREKKEVTEWCWYVDTQLTYIQSDDDWHRESYMISCVQWNPLQSILLLLTYAICAIKE